MGTQARKLTKMESGRERISPILFRSNGLANIARYSEQFGDKQFGRLKPLGFEENARSKGGHILWRFLCDCGNEYAAPPKKVLDGAVVSCGCKRHPDLIGQRFGRLTIIGRGHSAYTQVYWHCICDCGSPHVVQGSHLKSKTVQSCGCLQGGVTATISKGYQEISGSHWNRIWKASIYRRTRTLSFELTIEYAWDLYLAQERRCALSGRHIAFDYTPGHEGHPTASLDRIDSSKGYVPTNVQWVHKSINMMKSSLSDEDFISWCCKITKHFSPVDSLDRNV